MNSGNPADRIRLIEGSLRCFTYSLIGLIPLLGVLMAFSALLSGIKLRTRSRGVWNPARLYLYMGLAFATLGLLVSVGLGAWLQLVLMKNMGFF